MFSHKTLQKYFLTSLYPFFSEINYLLLHRKQRQNDKKFTFAIVMAHTVLAQIALQEKPGKQSRWNHKYFTSSYFEKCLLYLLFLSQHISTPPLSYVIPLLTKDALKYTNTNLKPSKQRFCFAGRAWMYDGLSEQTCRIPFPEMGCRERIQPEQIRMAIRKILWWQQRSSRCYLRTSSNGIPGSILIFIQKRLLPLSHFLNVYICVY